MKNACYFIKKSLTREIFTRVVILFSVLITALVAGAQVPQAFTYQAVARNSAGDVLANQNVTFRMSIIQGTLPGTMVYSEKHVTTTNEFGLATLEIGRGTVYSGNFSTIDWSVTPTFIKTEMDPTGGVSFINMGTTELLSVPYAIQAGEAGPDNDWVVSGNNQYSAVPGNVGIGLDNPLTKLAVKGRIRAGSLTDDTEFIEMSHEASFARINWSSNKELWITNNEFPPRLVLTQYGNLGIGTMTPTHLLEVGGHMRLNGRLYDANVEFGSNGQFLSSTGNGVAWTDLPSYLVSGSGIASSVAFWSGTNTLSANSNLYWDNNQNRLGINNPSPSYAVDVRGNDLHVGYFANTGATMGSAAVTGTNWVSISTSYFCGVKGTISGYGVPNSFGVVGSNGSTGTGVGAWSYGGDLIRAYSGTFPSYVSLRFYVNQSGQVYADGGYNTFKETGGKKQVVVKALQCPEALIEDCGSAELVNGQALVTIDPIFVEIAGTVGQYQVFLTPVSEDIVMMVACNKTATSFTVKGVTMDGKPATCGFDYRIVSRDNESKSGRFEKVDIPEPVIVPREE